MYNIHTLLFGYAAAGISIQEDVHCHARPPGGDVGRFLANALGTQQHHCSDDDQGKGTRTGWLHSYFLNVQFSNLRVKNLRISS